MTRWGAYVEQRIDDLRYGKGREDWEGEWPSPATAASAWDWACDLFPDDAPTPSVVPTADGGIDFVWRKGGWDLELGVDRESHALLWACHRGSGEDRTGDMDEAADREWFRRLLSELGDCGRALRTRGG